MHNINEIYQQLLQPSSALIADIAALKGDIIILGAGGKMGPALAKLAKHATELAGVKKRGDKKSRGPCPQERPKFCDGGHIQLAP